MKRFEHYESFLHYSCKQNLSCRHINTFSVKKEMKNVSLFSVNSLFTYTIFYSFAEIFCTYKVYNHIMLDAYGAVIDLCSLVWSRGWVLVAATNLCKQLRKHLRGLA